MQLRLGMLGAPHVDAFVLRSWRRRCIGEAKLRDQLKVASSVQEGLGTPFFAAFSPLVLSQLEQIPEPISQKGDLLTKWDVTMLVASIMWHGQSLRLISWRKPGMETKSTFNPASFNRAAVALPQIGRMNQSACHECIQFAG